MALTGRTASLGEARKLWTGNTGPWENPDRRNSAWEVEVDQGAEITWRRGCSSLGEELYLLSILGEDEQIWGPVSIKVGHLE